MRRFGLIALIAACFVLPAHAKPPRAGLEVAPPPPVISTNDNDCAIIAAVAKQHLKLGPDNPAPPMKPVDGFAPACNWPAHGLAFTAWKEGGPEFLSFAQPTYDAAGATIAVSKVNGPLAGQGWLCRLRSGVAGWTVDKCDAAWVS